MKLNDIDNSTLALYCIYCMHEIKPREKGRGYFFKIKVYSSGNDVQWFCYNDCEVMRKDMEFIDKWIHVKEMQQIVTDGE